MIGYGKKFITFSFLNSRRSITGGVYKIKIVQPVQGYLFNRFFYLQELGYCPQFDAQWKTITIEEHLEVFAAIRGVPPSAINNLVQRYLVLLIKGCQGASSLFLI